MDKALLIDISPPQITSDEDIKARKYELKSLVSTYGKFKILDVWGKKADPDMKLFLRKGLLDEAIVYCREHKITHLVLGNILKPRQIWELSELFREENVIVWDRVDCILNIFSLHAHSSEAKLQIQLAKIRHMGPRIFGMGDELSRQGGGGNTTRGQGETNTEIMKRHLRKEAQHIEKKLEKVRRTKCLHRQNRKRQGKETVALVGYTNAGKSTIMNRVSKKGVEVKDALFQTLDTRIGKMFLPKTFREIFISDTIGFISDLPPQLIAAFQSTLSESIYADLLLHVVDISDERWKDKIDIVDDILNKLEIGDKPQVLVCNKIDMLSSAEKIIREKYIMKEYAKRNPVFVSAHENLNMESLQNIIDEKIPKGHFDSSSCYNS